jgi:hypothetical protein
MTMAELERRRAVLDRRGAVRPSIEAFEPLATALVEEAATTIELAGGDPVPEGRLAYHQGQRHAYAKAIALLALPDGMPPYEVDGLADRLEVAALEAAEVGRTGLDLEDVHTARRKSQEGRRR